MHAIGTALLLICFAGDEKAEVSSRARDSRNRRAARQRRAQSQAQRAQTAA